MDPVPPKTCNYSCVYCQLGRTTRPTTRRADFFPPEEIVSETVARAKGLRRLAVDWITIVGSGEPTLHAGLGWMVREIKRKTGLPVAVITNGSLLLRRDVREELLAADAVLPSLDAATASLHHRIHRPLAGFEIDEILEGWIEFRRMYRGKLWIEMMMIANLNDTETALRQLAAAVRRIGPDAVHLSLPVRPPCEEWVRPSDDDRVERALTLLRKVVPVRPAMVPDGNVGDPADIDSAILSVITRHPMEEDELALVLRRWPRDRISRGLWRLLSEGRVRSVARYGRCFWSAAGAHYGEGRRDATVSRGAGRLTV